MLIILNRMGKVHPNLTMNDSTYQMLLLISKRKPTISTDSCGGTRSILNDLLSHGKTLSLLTYIVYFKSDKYEYDESYLLRYLNVHVKNNDSLELVFQLFTQRMPFEEAVFFVYCKAIKYESIELLSFVFEKSKGLCYLNDNISLLLLVIAAQWLKGTQYLLRANNTSSFINHTSNDDNCALSLAVEHDHCGIVQSLISCKVNLFWRNKYGFDITTYSISSRMDQLLVHSRLRKIKKLKKKMKK